ncbi:2531_t:CDS:2 [Entrophospora sp. SA101]|nr:2531_t:CDS:2 [Entrophospora sp. SA101]
MDNKQVEHWEVFEWFRVSSNLYQLILLVLIELKDTSGKTRLIIEEDLSVMNEINEINDKYNNLLAKYNELLAKRNAESTNSGHKDGKTLPQKFDKVNEQFEHEFEQMNEQLLENKKIDAQIVEILNLQSALGDAINELTNTKKKVFALQVELKDVNNYAEKKLLNLQVALGDTTNELTSAKKKVFNLQAALGDATNVSLTAIMNHTDLMIKCTTELFQTRDIYDHITKMTRQKIYETLELYGFNSDHPFINSIRNNIIDEMNKYREILDEEKKRRMSLGTGPFWY